MGVAGGRLIIIKRILFITAVIIIPVGVACLLSLIARKSRGIALLIILLLATSAIYNGYDNNRIAVKQETIYIKDLPAAFEGFKILQLSDLHGKQFGEGQSKLVAVINELEYDMIAATGDMATTSASFEPFLEIVDGLRNKNQLFYVNGNNDMAYDPLTGLKTEAGNELEEHGCILLIRPYPIICDGQTLWLANDLTKHFPNSDAYREKSLNYFHFEEQYLAYKERWSEWLEITGRIKNNEDIKIALTHIPHTRHDLEQKNAQENNWDYDLIIAGHYHGGQIRIPFYGALYIPMASGFTSGWFPDQKEVSGLVEYGGIQQYVSRGLGANIIPFRLFNTPEINLLTLEAR